MYAEKVLAMSVKHIVHKSVRLQSYTARHDAPVMMPLYTTYV